MDPVQITWEIAFKVWWALAWRNFLLGLPAFGIVKIFDEFTWWPDPVIFFFYLAAGVFPAIAVLKWWILGKNFGGFELWPVRERQP